MSDLKQEIKDLETEYRLQKKHLEADGVLDASDKQQLNSMKAMINKVKAQLKKQEAEVKADKPDANKKADSKTKTDSKGNNTAADEHVEPKKGDDIPSSVETTEGKLDGLQETTDKDEIADNEEKKLSSEMPVEQEDKTKKEEKEFDIQNPLGHIEFQDKEEAKTFSEVSFGNSDGEAAKVLLNEKGEIEGLGYEGELNDKLTASGEFAITEKEIIGKVAGEYTFVEVESKDLRIPCSYPISCRGKFWVKAKVAVVGKLERKDEGKASVAISVTLTIGGSFSLVLLGKNYGQPFEFVIENKISIAKTISAGVYYDGKTLKLNFAKINIPIKLGMVGKVQFTKDIRTALKGAGVPTSVAVNIAECELARFQLNGMNIQIISANDMKKIKGVIVDGKDKSVAGQRIQTAIETLMAIYQTHQNSIEIVNETLHDTEDVARDYLGDEFVDKSIEQMHDVSDVMHEAGVELDKIHDNMIDQTADYIKTGVETYEKVKNYFADEEDKEE